MIIKKNKVQEGKRVSGCGQTIPSPFKRTLFWPQKASTPNKRSKQKVPSVATSEEWKKYLAKKREKKDHIEKEKEERRNEREEKKIREQKKGATKQKRKEILTEQSSDFSIDIFLESE